ncbi:MAG: DNA gyrase subunit A [Chloroflexi bacterium]|nr:MAG: DNA gyrase subunit A [Chloroflexota bacterium]
MELGNIKPVSIVEQMTGAYLDYSMSVIVSRALPDVRDGLKPVHRRVLYAMDQMGLQSTKQFRKCAGTVGEVLKSYHPHGDVAVYDSLVRMAQPWSMRYPLVLGQGNFGSQDDDPPAAMRYTEAKMAAIADELLSDIDKDTIDFVPNYDNQTKEPTVLPARLPNLLLNGSTGIAVGMATNIPPHNLIEVCDGISYLIDHPDATTEELSRIVRGPDFPTGGIIQGREGIRNTYANGRGRIVVRARTYFEETERGRVSIIVTELPYQINKADLVKKIAELARDKKIDGISEVRDESDRKGMRMVIELKRDANPENILNSLFKYTAMQSAFNANMLALVEQQPRTLTLKAFLQHHINHREIVITRRTRYELAKAEARKHILEGLKIALDNLDTVINTIRQSQAADDALVNLRRQFNFSEEQGKAILDMRLARLAALERSKIEEELKDVLKNIDYYHLLLSDIQEIRKIIKDDLRELKEKYGDPRRTDLGEAEAGEFKDEDLISNDEVVVTLTEKGYIKRLPSSTYRAQRRGGRGITGMATREDDAVRHLLVAHSHDGLLFFTDRGRVFQLKVYELPEVSRTAKGEHLINLIAIEQRERVTAIVYVPKGVSRDYMIVATKKGEVKKTAMDEFEVVRRSGLIAMDLEEDDELIGAKLAHADDDVLIITAQGKAIRFTVTELRSASRTSGGVRGIRLGEGNDRAVSLNLTPKDSELLVVTEKGYGKCTPIDDYPTQSRGGNGVITLKVTEKTGPVAAARVIGDNDSDLMIISAGGVVIRMDVGNIIRGGRAIQGRRMMNLDEGDTVVAVATTNGKKMDSQNGLDEEEEAAQDDGGDDEAEETSNTDIADV